MILNGRQYKVTKAQVARLQMALGAARKLRKKMDARAYKAMVVGFQSQVAELRGQLREYEGLRRAKVLRLESAELLAEVLIKGRIARGYTQRDLAEKLDVKPQQIQRYEATRYQTASLRRMLDIMRVLGLELRADVPLGPQSDLDSAEM